MITFNEETHSYYENDVRLPGVTELISWGLHEDLSGIPETILAKATEFGNAVHKLTAQSDWGLLGPSDVPDVLVKPISAWNEFVKGYEVLDIEKIYSYDGFAGTIDRVVRKDNMLYILDIKTCSTLKRKVGLQLSAYAYLYAQNNNVGWDELKLIAVQLDQHGNIKVKEYENEWLVFKAILDLWNWCNKFKRGNNGTSKSLSSDTE